MIVISCSAVGFSLSRNCKKRVDALKSFLNAFNIIKSELAFKNSSRSDLFNAAINQCNGIASDYLRLLTKEDDNDFPANALSDFLKKTELKSAEIVDISEGLNIIGKYDLSTQQDLIDKTIRRIELMLDNASLEMSKNSKLYKVLGISTGLIVGMLLL